ncbi:hypothetical protein HID58_032654, partial [Brassica napus]
YHFQYRSCLMAKSSILLAYSETGSCSSTVKESMTIAISVHMIQQDPNCSYSLVHPIPSYKGRSKEDNKTTVNQIENTLECDVNENSFRLLRCGELMGVNLIMVDQKVQYFCALSVEKQILLSLKSTKFFSTKR